jgi:IMP dehydrogenase
MLLDKVEGLTFDDVTLVPQLSDVKSRHNVSLACGSHFGLEMTTPILSANMATVTGKTMCEEIRSLGGLGFLHRFGDVLVPNCDFVASIGVNSYTDKLRAFKTMGVKSICIDVAHGHHTKVAKTIKFIRDAFGRDGFRIIAGNVCTPEGALYLAKAGADIIKVGVGPGSHCTTRVVTGHGVPQLTAILTVAEAIRDYNPLIGIIADGGIRNSGDIAKSLAAGADYVMIGKLLAGTEEAPSEAVMRNGVLVKVYRGSASYEAQVDMRLKRTIISEGVESTVPYIGSVSNVIHKLSNGIKSACSYSGVSELKNFKHKAKLMRVSSASYIEGTPHGA